MQITPVNCFNNYKNNSYTATSFKSVMPVRVYVDGRPSVDRKIVKRGLRLATDVLFKRSADNLSSEVKRCFSHFVGDYTDPAGEGAKSHFFRTRARNGKSYLFTGEHAKKLDEIGKERGIAMHRGIDEYGTSKTYEAGIEGRKYIEQRIAYTADPSLLKNRGENIDFCIFLKSNGVPGKRGFKLFLERVAFRWSQHKAPPPAAQALPSQQIATTVTHPAPHKGGRRRYIDPGQGLFPFARH